MDWSKLVPPAVAALIAGLGAWTGVRVEMGGMGTDIAYLKSGLSRLEERIERFTEVEKRQGVMEYRLDQLEKRK